MVLSTAPTAVYATGLRFMHAFCGKGVRLPSSVVHSCVVLIPLGWNTGFRLLLLLLPNRDDPWVHFRSMLNQHSLFESAHSCEEAAAGLAVALLQAGNERFGDVCHCRGGHYKLPRLFIARLPYRTELHTRGAPPLVISKLPTNICNLFFHVAPLCE